MSTTRISSSSTPPRTRWSLEEGIVKSGDRHLEQGVGVRAQSGERQGYAHSDDVTVESLRIAADSPPGPSPADRRLRPQRWRWGGRPGPSTSTRWRGLRPRCRSSARSRLLGEIDAYARGLDPRVKQVMASVRLPAPAAARGRERRNAQRSDVRPLVRLNVQVIAADASGTRREIGYQGAGRTLRAGAPARARAQWQPLVSEAVRIATLNLDAEPCPAGSMDVVLGPGWPGVLLHEAIGHGLEGDFNRKKTSAFSDRIGERVASRGRHGGR